MKLHEFHARSLESTLILADESVLRIRRLLRDAGQRGIIRQITNSLSEVKRDELESNAEELHRMFTKFAEDFSLEPHPLDLRRVLDAELSSLWVDLQDCRPDRMKGYGQPFSPEAQKRLESTIEDLLAQIEAMRMTLLED
ncbi:MAG TPA: hypothetical protein VLV88_04990 [Terriglobales bacterium]|nr:hypothetical protein [Terriglobales bacterium]